MLENFASYIRNKGIEYNIILKELTNIQHYQPQGRPPYSSMMIRFALLLRYSSLQTYKLLLKQLPLPSLTLLKRLTTGVVDAVKVAKLYIPCVIRSRPETKISGEWLKDEINICMFDLKECGFKVRAIVTDDHVP